MGGAAHAAERGGEGTGGSTGPGKEGGGGGQEEPEKTVARI